MTEHAIPLQPGWEAVVVTLKIGPQRGGTLISISTRPGGLDQIITDMRAAPRQKRKAIRRSITGAIRQIVDSPAVELLSPENDNDFMADLQLLAAFHEVEGEKVLAEAGIARLARVSPDRPAPAWLPVTVEIARVH